MFIINIIALFFVDSDTEEEQEGSENWLAKLQQFFSSKLNIEEEQDLPKVKHGLIFKINI